MWLQRLDRRALLHSSNLCRLVNLQRYFLSGRYDTVENQLPRDKQRSFLRNMEASKKLRGDEEVRNPVIPPGINEDIHALLDEASKSSVIIDIVKTHINRIEHVSVFGKAMKKCDKMTDWKSVREIMDLLLCSDVQPDPIAFNIYMNSMARSDAPGQCIHSFRTMVEDHKLKPDVFHINVLLKSCRRQGRSKDAERTWKDMKKRHKLVPNHFTYAEMILVYAKAHENEKAKTLFEEYLEKVRNKDLPASDTTMGSYLNVSSRSGDLKEMERTLELRQKFGFEPNAVTVADMMRGCFAAREFEHCIVVFDEWIKGKKKPSMPMMFLKCCALNGMIRTAESPELKQKHYWDLWQTIYEDLLRYDLNVDFQIVTTQLGALIWMCGDQDPRVIVQEFEALVDKGLIGYQSYDERLQQNVIELHHFEPWAAQFIIRYVIGIQLKSVMSIEQKELWIIVGRGKHTDGKRNKRGSLKDFITHELASWNPPIIALSSTTVPGRLYIERKHLEHYLRSEDNYAKQKLTIPSNDWFIPDD